MVDVATTADGPGVRGFAGAIATGDLSHSGDAILAAHIGNAHRRAVAVRDEDGEPLWTIAKERADSPHKIDAAVAAVLSWEARTDAIAAGAGREEPSIYETRGLIEVDGVGSRCPPRRQRPARIGSRADSTRRARLTVSVRCIVTAPGAARPRPIVILALLDLS